MSARGPLSAFAMACALGLSGAANVRVWLLGTDDTAPVWSHELTRSSLDAAF